MNRVTPWHQTNWDWRAAGNFLCGGAGTGLYLVTAWAPEFGGPLRLVGLVGLALVGIGLGCVWLEIGRPLRALNVYLHYRTSWMSREAWFALPYFGFGLLGLWFDAPALIVLAALSGLAFLYCQAKMLPASKGIPAWRQPELVPFMLVTGLAEGTGLALILASALAGPVTWHIWGLVVLLVIRAALWRRYRQATRTAGVPVKARAVLDGMDRPLLWGGHALPLFLAAAALAAGDIAAWAAWAAALAGLATLAGGWYAKFTLITRTAYNQGFALAKLPVRGSGVPGPAAKPGWQ